MRKLIATIILLGGLTPALLAQTVSHTETFDSLKFEYHTMDGRLHGEYTAWYPNGQMKAKGSFYENQRNGEWKAWDEQGKLRMEREYLSPFHFKRTQPEPAKGKLAKWLSTPSYTPTRNEAGFYEYHYLAERAVIWSKRNWRWITPEHNEALFKEGKFFDRLKQHIFKDGTVMAYMGSNDEFRSPMTYDEIEALWSLKSMDLIAYEIKEDFFYDVDRQISETRIIGLAPVMLNRETGDTTHLYWVYYPELRYALANDAVSPSEGDARTMTIDDIFFHRNFASVIVKQSNIYDRRIEDYIKEPKARLQEATRIELMLLEAEHDIWVSFSAPSKP